MTKEVKETICAHKNTTISIRSRYDRSAKELHRTTVWTCINCGEVANCSHESFDMESAPFVEMEASVGDHDYELTWKTSVGDEEYVRKESHEKKDGDYRTFIGSAVHVLRGIKAPAVRGKLHCEPFVANAVNLGWISKWEKQGWLTKNGKPVKNKDLWIELRNQLAKHLIQVIPNR